MRRSIWRRSPNPRQRPLNAANAASFGLGYWFDNRTVGWHVSTPDHSSLDIASDIDIRVLAETVNPEFGSSATLVGKGDPIATSTDSYYFGKQANDLPALQIRNSAGTLINTLGTVAGFFVATARWYRATLDVDNGSSQRVARFYYSDEPIETDPNAVNWTLHDTTTISGVTDIRVGDDELWIGEIPTTGRPWEGRIYYVEVRNGIAGTIVANPDFRYRTDLNSPTQLTDSVGKVWTISSPSRWVLPLQVAEPIRVGNEFQALWDVRTPIGDTNQLVWDVRTPIGDTNQLVWDVRTPVGDSNQLVWDVQTGTLPVVEELTVTQFAANSATWTVNMPATVDAGDLLITVFGADGTPTFTLVAGWDPIIMVEGPAQASLSAFAKIALGTEGGTTVNWTLGSAQDGAAHVYRISKFAGLPTPGVKTNHSGGPIPGSPVTLNWGTRNLLVIQATSVDHDVAAVGVPVGFTDQTVTASGAGDANGATLITQRREYGAQPNGTITPGDFAQDDTAPGTTITLVIRGEVDEDDSGFASFFDITNGRVSTPAHASLNIAGDVDIRVLVRYPILQTGAIQYILSKGDMNFNSGYSLRKSANNDGFQLFFKGVSGGSKLANSSVGVGAYVTGEATWLRAVLDVDNGAGQYEVSFYHSTEAADLDPDTVTWTFINTVVGTSGVITLGGNDPMWLGNLNPESAVGRYRGEILYAEVRNGIAGTKVANPDFRTNDQLDSATQLTDDYRVWTVDSPAIWYHRPVTTTPIGDTNQLVWDVRSALGDTNQLVWDVRAKIGDTNQLVWDVRSALGDTNQLVWDVRTALGDTCQLVWDTRAAIGDINSLLWDVAFALGDTCQLVWDVYTPIGVDNQLVWDVRTFVGDTNSLLWDLFFAIGDTSQFVWDVRTFVGDNNSLLWDVYTPIGDEFQVLWDTRAAAGDSNALLWDVALALGDTVSLLWDAAFAIGDSNQLVWDVTALATDSVQLLWDLAFALGDSNQLIWDVRELTPKANGYALFDGISGQVSTPDHASLDITGDIDIRALIDANDWGDDHVVLSKWLVDVTDASYRFFIGPAGLGFASYDPTYGVTLGFVGISPHPWVRMTVDVDNGAGSRTLRGYSSDQPLETDPADVVWNLEGSSTSGPVAPIAVSSAPVRLGVFRTDDDLFDGKIYYAEIRNGIDGTTVANPDFRSDAQRTGPDELTDDTGKVWTVEASTVWVPGRLLRLRWDVYTAIGDQTSLLWDLAFAVGDNNQLLWDVLTTVNDLNQLVWDVLTFVGDNTSLLWDARAAIGDSNQLVWDLRATVADTLSLLWDVLRDYVYLRPVSTVSNDGWDSGPITGNPLWDQIDEVMADDDDYIWVTV